MNREQFETATFEEVVDWANENVGEFISYNTLKDFAVTMIEEDNIFLAIHVLEAMNEDDADYYLYDTSMGTLETPIPIDCKEDLEDFIEE